MNSTRQQVEGRVREAVGRIKEAVGKAFGNGKLEAEGKLEKNIGAWKAEAGQGEPAPKPPAASS